MNKKKKIIGVDFDDVLMDTNTALALFHNEMYGTSLTRNHIFSYDLEKVWKCTIEEVQVRLDKFFDSPNHTLTLPVPGAVEAVQQLARNYNLLVVTARPAHRRGVTEGLLDRYFPGLFKELHFVHHHQEGTLKKRTKAEVCKELGIEIFIEDALIHALPIGAMGVTTYLFNAPWNQEVFPESDLITRVNSWEEVLKKIEERFW